METKPNGAKCGHHLPNHLRPQRLRKPPQSGQAAPAPLAGICAICHFPGLTSPCGRCRSRERMLAPKPAAPQPAKTLDLGPLPTPESITTKLDHPAIQWALSNAEEGIGPNGEQLLDYVGHIEPQTYANMANWMERNGAREPSKALPSGSYWVLSCPDAHLSLCRMPSGRVGITLALIPQDPPVPVSRPSLRVIQGGVR